MPFSLRDYVSVLCAVADGVPELLAPGRGPFDQDESLAVAHLPRSLHLWAGRGHSRDRAPGEADVPPDSEKCTETLPRVHGCQWTRTRARPPRWSRDSSCCFPDVRCSPEEANVLWPDQEFDILGTARLNIRSCTCESGHGETTPPVSIELVCLFCSCTFSLPLVQCSLAQRKKS